MCVDALKHLRGNERNTKGLYAYIGFKKKAIEYEESARVAGETKWRLSDFIRLAINGITSYEFIYETPFLTIGLFLTFADLIGLLILLRQSSKKDN